MVWRGVGVRRRDGVRMRKGVRRREGARTGVGVGMEGVGGQGADGAWPSEGGRAQHLLLWRLLRLCRVRHTHDERTALPHPRLAGRYAVGGRAGGQADRPIGGRQADK